MLTYSERSETPDVSSLSLYLYTFIPLYLYTFIPYDILFIPIPYPFLPALNKPGLINFRKPLFHAFQDS